MGRLLSETKAPELIEYVMKPFLADMNDYFGAHLRIHKAHVVMLGEQGLISEEEAQAILAALREMGQVGKEGLNLNHDTDLYMQMEAFVKNKAANAGGKMHMGRSRNDLYSCGARLLTRAKLSGVISDVLGLQEQVLRRAQEHAETVMPGYTHLQHAEPITLGLFLLAFNDVLTRDVTRLVAAYNCTNANTLGSAALAGSSFNLNRDRTTELLGFDGMVENAYDAVASRDYIVEAASVLAVLDSNITRVVDSLIIWSTSEFGMIDMPDSYGYTSSIMPQKRNPGYFLESIRSKSARVTGDVAGAFCTLKGTTFAQSRDTSYEITIPLFRAFDETSSIVNVMRGVMGAMIVRAEEMERNCASEFSGSTEIANCLVEEIGLDFRSAYTVVANTVRQASERGLSPKDVNSAMIDVISTEVLGRPVGLTEAQVRMALDPRGNVEKKRTVGCPSKSEMARMLESRSEQLSVSRDTHQERLNRLTLADDHLELAIDSQLS